MASTFKTFVSDDIANTRTLLHESIPITGSIVNGTTYTNNQGVETNIKTHGHGMFQSVYDYPYQSSSANHIFDMTVGENDSGVTASTADFYSKQKNIYNQMAQVLVGHDVNGSIRDFDQDGDLTDGDKHDSVIFFNFARLLGKDEIKKGTFSMNLGMTEVYANRLDGVQALVIADTGAATDYKVNSPAGEYGILRATGTSGDPLTADDVPCGLIYYQAGIVVISTGLFLETGQNTNGLLKGATYNAAGPKANVGEQDTLAARFADNSHTMDEISKAVRDRILNIQFSNTTELNSTIYFCRVGHNDFNYSSNPTYLEKSKIRVKNKSTDAPVSYITTVGLYSADNELLAAAKLSEPLRKDPTNDMTLRVRLDY